MSMNLAKQTYAYEPQRLIAGVDIGITTAVKEAGADLKPGAPVLLAEGKVSPVTSTTDLSGLYGICSEDFKSGEEAVIYLCGEFWADALALEDGVTAAALELPLRKMGIYLK